MFCVRTERARLSEVSHTLISLSGMAPAKRFASLEISNSSRAGPSCAGCMRLAPGIFISDVSTDVVSVVDADGRGGKKHLKMPSACHFVALVK